MITLRWLMAFGCLYLAFRAVVEASLYQHTVFLVRSIFSVGVAGYFILGFAALLTVLLLLSPEVIIPICKFFSRPFTYIFFPEDKFDKPPLNYTLARRFAVQMRYSDALEEYKKILYYYPKEMDAYREIISIYNITSNKKLASRYTKRFKRLYPKESLKPTRNPVGSLPHNDVFFPTTPMRRG
jgi:tetratricopeptide (TPR) repeat protein